MKGLLERAYVHDANEERRYLRGSDQWPVCFTWNWGWLAWFFGVGWDYSPYGSERGSVWVHLGPLTFEVYVPRRRKEWR